MKKFLLFSIVVLWVGPAVAQTILVDRKSTVSLVRDLTAEATTTYLGDTSLIRFVNYAQTVTNLAMQERTASVILDTFITTAMTLRYVLTHTAATQDTIESGRVAAVIYKGTTASGGKEEALAWVPPEMLGRSGAGLQPAFYSVIGRTLLLGKSPLGGDTLFVYMIRAPRDLSADATLLTVSKEDQPAVALLAASWVCLRDHVWNGYDRFYAMWKDCVNMKHSPYSPSPPPAPTQ